MHTLTFLVAEEVISANVAEDRSYDPAAAVPYAQPPGKLTTPGTYAQKQSQPHRMYQKR